MARKQFSSSRYKFNNTKWLTKSEGTLQNQEIWDFCLREILRCHVPIHTVWSKKKLKNKGPYHLRLLLAVYFCPSPFSFNANSKLETKTTHSLYGKTTITKKRILDYQYWWCHFLTKTYFWLLDWSLTEAKWPNISSFAHSWTSQTCTAFTIYKLFKTFYSSLVFT